MKKSRIAISAIGCIVLIGLILSVSFRRPKDEVAVMKPYKVFFGDSPKTVAAELGQSLAEKSVIKITDKVVYQYTTTILESEAELRCFFRNDAQLAELHIAISTNSEKQTAELFEKAVACITDAYEAQETFERSDIEYLSQSRYSISLGTNEGATGITYEVTADQTELRIICVDCR